MDVERIDPRQQRTRDAVLTAARTVLRRDGVQGATMEAIAAESGVARSTLYRNWDSREALLDDAIDAVTGTASPDDDGPPLERLGTAVQELAANLQSSEWGATLPSIVAALDASPEFAERYRGFVDGRRGEVRRIIDDAVESGALPGHVDADDLIDDLVGPLFYRRLIRRVPTSPAWTAAHVDRITRAHASTG